jgi:hypothetical protein
MFRNNIGVHLYCRILPGICEQTYFDHAHSCHCHRELILYCIQTINILAGLYEELQSISVNSVEISAAREVISVYDRDNSADHGQTYGSLRELPA